jgi:GntR family transcriptional regulator / MocR family aminotransferase
VRGIAAGLHLVLELPAGAASEAAVLAAAGRRSLALTGLSAFWHAPAERPTAVQVGYATPPDHAFGGALDALAAVMRAAASRDS